MNKNNNYIEFFDEVVQGRAFKSTINNFIKGHEANLLDLISDLQQYEKQYILPNFKSFKVKDGKKYGYNHWLRDNYPEWVNFKKQLTNANHTLNSRSAITVFHFKNEFIDVPTFLQGFYNVGENVEFIAERFKRNIPKPRKEKNGTFVSNPHNLTERAKEFQNETVALFVQETTTNIYETPPHKYPELFIEDVKQLIEYCNTCISIIEQDKEYYFNLITEPYHASITGAKRPNWYEIIYNSLERVKRSAELYLQELEDNITTPQEIRFKDFFRELSEAKINQIQEKYKNATNKEKAALIQYLVQESIVYIDINNRHKNGNNRQNFCRTLTGNKKFDGRTVNKYFITATNELKKELFFDNEPETIEKQIKTILAQDS